MATVGPFAPGTMAVESGGGITWVNADNAKVNADGLFASATYPQSTPAMLYHSLFLLARNYNGGAIVPAGATIGTVVFTIYRKANRAAAAYAIDEYVYLNKTSGHTGSNKAYTNTSTDKWPAVSAAAKTYTFTNGTDMSITAADVNSANFGLAFVAGMMNGTETDIIAYVDFVELTQVSYTPAASGRMLRPSDWQGNFRSLTGGFTGLFHLPRPRLPILGNFLPRRVA